MAAFSWAETYHRDARRKSVFMLQLRCATFRLPLPPITHAPARLAPRE